MMSKETRQALYFLLPLIFLAVFVSGCVQTSTGGPEDGSYSAPDSARDGNICHYFNNDDLQVQDRNIDTDLAVPPQGSEDDSLYLEIDKNALYEIENSKRTKLDFEPYCFEDVCYFSLGLAKDLKKINIDLKDANGLSPLDFSPRSKGISIAYTFSPVIRKKCFKMSEKQYENYLERKDIETYCNKLAELNGITGLNFDDNFALFVTSQPVSELRYAARYLGNNGVEVDAFSLYGQRIWVVILHEFVHYGAEGLNLPPWLEEGLADYASYTVNDELIYKPQPTPEQITGWDPYDNAFDDEENSRRYNYVAYAIKIFARGHGLDKLPDALNYYKEFKVVPEESGIQKNKYLESALQKALQDQNYSLQEFAYPD